jgi:dihydrofolate synthase/folylpolyglutamate synthase
MKRMGTIDEALDYLYSFINYETDSSYSYKAFYYNVERTLILLNRIGAPHEGKRIIHVAGTKAKGSVCRIITSVLEAQNSRTGLFTSPHIDRVNERIAVGGQDIDDEEIIDILNEVRTVIEEFPMSTLPTTFEILTAMAMLHFRRQNTEWVVLETGMGGRFDSTNFASPAVSVITPISFDHTDKLGSTIEQIAREKAGIIKSRCPVVLGYQRYPVADIFRARAKELNSELSSVEALCSYRIISMSPEGVRFSAEVDGTLLEELVLGLTGEHQVQNAVTALLTLKTVDMLPRGEIVRKALEGIGFPTRLELIERRRRFLLDSAHNRDSAEVVARAVREIYSYERLFSIVGIVKGKDIEGIIGCIASVSDELVICEPVTHKELDTALVYRSAKNHFPGSSLIADIRQAIDAVVQSSTERDLILITGSFYTTSPARSYILSAL